MTDPYANIIVDISHEKLDKPFQYRIPEDMRGKLLPGMVVEIPFGRGDRLIKGYVIGTTKQAQIDPERIKCIHAVSTDGIGVESRLIALAAWMRDYYGATMIQALKTVIPVRKKEKPKEKKQVLLAVSEEEARERLTFFEKKHQTARYRLLKALLEEGFLPWELVTAKLNIPPAVIRSVEKMGLLKIQVDTVYRNPVHVKAARQQAVILNREQQGVVDGIREEWENENARPCLIHGVTGCGKTEIYMELIAGVLKEGKQAIVLIPEIALTYQTVMRFYRRFGDRISVMNSRLSPGERFDQYERARKGLIDVMIGPRSALFTPFPNLGIIIQDEEHETSYQSETVPRYLTRETAVKRGELEHAHVIFGTATPSVDAYYKAEKGEYKLFTIRQRVKHAALPEVSIVDLREELKKGNRSVLSNALKEEMAQCLGAGHQMMLFLNRRGYAGFLSCRSCGQVIECPHCDVSLSLHRGGRLICHYCGYETTVPQTCPSCGSPFLRDFGIGTQQVESVVAREFPGARILRMDLDTTREKDGHEKILSAFANGEAEILIGTQMIVKGHDFPNVTLVGILAADLSLHASDFRAAERTFQLLTQAAGRAGRGGLPGRVVIQTYDPEHYSIQAAAEQDYEAFYRQEIAFRTLGGYPPTGGMLAVHASSEDEAYLSMAMEYLKKFLEILENRTGIQVIGPGDETIARIQDVYRKVLYIRHSDEKRLTVVKEKVEQYIEMNEGYQKIHIQYERV